ncbi:MAG: hypothetical protein KBF49_10710, partial [Flavobacteriales bacterium]|nr:hypothetical protein [Flavobacteriales bacterium]
AILRGRLDQLIQNPSLGERDAEVIQGMYTASERMGRTVSDMLTLAKVGDGEFLPQKVDWARMFREEIALLSDLISASKLTVEINEESRCVIQLHPALAQLLASNLLRNAVQHNVPNGTLSLAIARESITVRNIGPALSVAPATLFDRFAKGDPSSTSPGLGLSMVREIAERNGLCVDYTVADGMHVITVQKG